MFPKPRLLQQQCRTSWVCPVTPELPLMGLCLLFPSFGGNVLVQTGDPASCFGLVPGLCAGVAACPGGSSPPACFCWAGTIFGTRKESPKTDWGTSNPIRQSTPLLVYCWPWFLHLFLHTRKNRVSLSSLSSQGGTHLSSLSPSWGRLQRQSITPPSAL